MAAPHVSGTIALMMEKNPYLTMSEIKNILSTTKMANGCVNAAAAVAATPSCCQGNPGNVDHSQDGLCTMSDLTYIITYLMIDPETWLPCRDAADVDRDGQIEIGDITAMIDYLFITFAPLPSCP